MSIWPGPSIDRWFVPAVDLDVRAGEPQAAAFKVCGLADDRRNGVRRVGFDHVQTVAADQHRLFARLSGLRFHQLDVVFDRQVRQRRLRALPTTRGREAVGR